MAPHYSSWERMCRQREKNDREKRQIREAIRACRNGNYSDLVLLEWEFLREFAMRRATDYGTTNEELRAWREAADAASGCLPDDTADRSPQ